MNKEELKRGAQWLRDNVKPWGFDMKMFRCGNESKHICNSVGCAVGWLTGSVLEEKIDEFRNEWGGIEFEKWSLDQYDLTFNEWRWCFDSMWAITDNTLEGAALRMEWLAEHGLPENWKDQLNRFEQLCYKHN